MSGKKKNRYFAKHAKSSAAVVSLGIHAILLVVALSFVAVTVIQKEEQNFEAKAVTRPKIKLNKLQAPMKMEKKRKPKPKLRKRLVVKPKLNQKIPDIKMPEITGVKGGFGSGAGDGLGGGGGVGFSMPEINIFGVKGKGEKIFIILDSSPSMMVDQMGGIPSYTLIKEELVKILGKLSPTVLFNIAVYEIGSSKVLFPKMVPATQGNVAKVKEWLDPLNAVSTGMGDRDYGIRTLGSVQGSQTVQGDFKVGKIEDQREWVKPVMHSMEEKADAVFLLSHGWGTLWATIGAADEWSESKWERWNKAVADSNQRHKEENEKRRSNGEAPRVFRDKRHMVRTYYPSVEQPPATKKYHYTPKDMADAMEVVRKKAKSGVPASSGIGNKRKGEFSVNVVHFIKKSGATERDEGQFRQLTRECDGEYRTLSGFEAIKGAASAE
ncbi:hypothetical protein PDESU_01085 [Pontiella desulfatans]|uniref:VWFA domain-containing protein n=1 Tax=Pontiella desulfatans TaxID=2750659 RepID=A0A6C2TY33_PONDE|nr:hypothetical protein [Pontiella desulfatans]VGO12532.1 hypothetical protein PDESU_01085 [Pontiella desulfatans]